MLHTTFGPHHCRRHLLQRLHHHQPHVGLAHFSRVRVSASYCFRWPGDRLVRFSCTHTGAAHWNTPRVVEVIESIFFSFIHRKI